MSDISNLYAAKIFAEHPLALWSLDDNNFFKTALNASSYYITNWNIFEDRAEWLEEYNVPQNHPYPDHNKAVLSKTSSASVTVVEIYGSEIYPSDLDLSKDSLCIASWIYEYGSLVDGYELGFKYVSGSVETIDSGVTNSLGSGNWREIHYTSLIQEDYDYIIPFIKVNYVDEVGGIEEYKVMFSGMSVAQWSEEYLHAGSGIQSEEFPVPILRNVLPPTNYSVYPLDAYGFQDEDTGYAIIDNNKLLARNTNFPMVYGSNNLTYIDSPISDGMPSLIFPGKGFLNKNGKYNDLTVEFWMRVSPNINTTTKIFGPIASKDGLYINKEYLELKIGKYKRSYFVGKWYRPMLIDIRYSPSVSSVLINGDLAIELPTELSELSFPEKSYDWIAFYGSQNINIFEIDCLSIYPYLVLDQIAKRRFIYGQAVQNPQTVTDSFNGDSYYIDFPFANYSSMINYPDMNPWNSGYFSNLDSNSRYLGFKNYEMPEIRFDGTAATVTLSITPNAWSQYQIDSWYDLLIDSWQNIYETNQDIVSDIYTDNFAIQSGSVPFFKIKPNNGYANVEASIEFDSINPIQERVASIYGVFEAPSVLPSSPETLMYFYNSINNNIFTITMDQNGLNYLYNGVLLENKQVSASSIFSAGIDIDRLNIEYATVIGNFFANPQNISLSLMGYGDSTYTGKMYHLTFNNAFFHNKDTYGWFDSDGLANNIVTPENTQYVGAYTFKPIVDNNTFVLDISCSGYWEDSIPLSYFGKSVLDKSGLSYYDLDMIQFNIDVPSPIFIASSASSNYSSNSVKTYITLQDIDQVGKVDYSIYSNTQEISSSRVLDFDNTVDVIETKFEVVDGSIIIPPKELVDFKDYYITIHIEAKVEGITNKVLQIRKMMLSSLVTDEKSFTEINTRTGNKIYPVAKYGTSYSFKDKNPFSIYPESTPYLYLTANSGINMLPYSSNATRAFSIPINRNRVSEYYLGGIQLWTMYNLDNTINSTIKIARITTPSKTYDLFIEPIDNGKRGMVKAYDVETGYINDIIVEVVGDLIFYQDGRPIKRPIINPSKWTSLIIVFGANIELASSSGTLELYEGLLYNNIAVYEKPISYINFTTGSRTWQETRFSELVTETEIITVENQWSDWTAFDWTYVYAPTELFQFAIDGGNILGSYIGTSGIVCNDTSSVIIDSEGADIFSDVVWDTRLVKPV